MTKCLWCKKGTYRQVAKPNDPHYIMERYGVNVVGEAQWEVWASGCCGHLAYVRLDMKNESELKVA